MIAKNLGISSERVYALFDDYADKIDKESVSWGDYEKIFKKEFGVELNLKGDLAEEFVRHFKKIEVVWDFLIEQVKKRPVGILSNVSERLYEIYEEKEMLPKVEYAAVVKSGELKMIKPEKEIYDYAAKQADVLGERILFLDDNEKNVRAAKELGWQAEIFETYFPERTIERVKNKYKL